MLRDSPAHRQEDDPNESQTKADPEETDGCAPTALALLILRVIVRGSRRHPGGCGGPGGFALFQWHARIAPLGLGPHRVLYDYRGLRSHPIGERTGRNPHPERVVAQQTVTVE